MQAEAKKHHHPAKKHGNSKGMPPKKGIFGKKIDV